MESLIWLQDVAEGGCRLVLTSAGRVEAPNIAPDGRSLLVNSEGGLCRVPLDQPALMPVETGIAGRCNNDHGFSPDGRWIAFSAHRGRGAELFLMPAAGGGARLLVEARPSWFHAFAPDGGRIAYAAARAGGPVDICTARAADGADERRLTGGEGHSDGPDYAADGRHIYYNSDRGGQAQIWRMGADGTGQRQLFADGRVNWFPHPSPDGAWVSYLSYPPGTEGHPADLPVDICLIRPDGSDRAVMRSILGGQGTMNVPHWSRDGRYLAFVSYRP